MEGSRIKLPQGALDILRCLEEAGYEAYIVGGCVRDALMGRVPSDWDITTDATPRQIKRLFHHTVDTGLQHGTVTVLRREEGRTVGYEVTTYRIDGVYEDARHPREVSFTSELAEDLRRRDFTINAMAYHPERGLVDLYGGQEDLRQGVIRAVGDARERFEEDALRMMRAIRFAAQLGASIEEATWGAILTLREKIRYVSAERIRVEMEKLLLSEHPADFRLFYESGLSAYFLPEWDVLMETAQENPHHCYNVGEHTLHALAALDTAGLRAAVGEEAYPAALRYVRIALLLHDIAKPPCKTVDAEGVAHFQGHPEMGARMAREILRRLHYDNDTIDTVAQLIAVHDMRWAATPQSIRRAMARTGERYFPMIFYLTRADVMGQSEYQRAEKLALIDAQEARYHEILDARECVTLRELAVGGRDLIQEGLRPGPALGELLERMLEDVLETPAHNEREYLLDTYVRKA